MAPLDTEAQFKFLIACIKFTKDGKPDFALVATECEIVSKGAAAKRYERLMKAHGITSNNGAARAGSAGPSEPSTPAGRKTPAASRPSTNKKRRLAARGDDLDDQVKTEVKTEVKHENNGLDSDGSYTIHPNDPPEAATSTCVTPATYFKTENNYVKTEEYGNDEVFLVSESQRHHGGSVTPVDLGQQKFMPPSPSDGFYSFIDPANEVHLLPPTSHPFTHGHDADHPTQTMTPPDPAIGHWLQHHHQNHPFF